MGITTIISNEQPLIALVTLKETGEIIDAERLTSRYMLETVLERHDMTRVEITYKAARQTAEAEAFGVNPPPKSFQANYDDDVPF